MPGYYRVAVNPFEALENMQGNCFTNAVIGAVALSNIYDVEASLAWSTRLHAQPVEEGISLGRKSDDPPLLNIQHIDLVVPRHVNKFDILRLAYGFQVVEGREGSVFQAEDLGGEIHNYNFEHEVKPDDICVSHLGEEDDPILFIADGGEIVPTLYGRSLGLESLDWQHAADEYLNALGLDELDYDALSQMFLAKYTAMKDWIDLETSREG